MAGTDPEQEIASIVRSLLREVAPGPCHGRELGDDLELGGSGLGLDSVSMVDLLLRCQETLAIPFLEDLLGQPALTLGSLLTTVRAARHG